jgi:hypothetical protein
MGWSYADLQEVPAAVYEVLVQMMTETITRDADAELEDLFASAV